MKDRKQLAADLKLIYTSATEKEAELALESFDQKWSKQYPHIASLSAKNTSNPDHL
uniref:transposase n=1 Tax=Rickettsia endosymbiont of Urophora cardui TaxID=3066265 RepID=UPI00397E297D